jgi:hypothetical protein
MKEETISWIIGAAFFGFFIFIFVFAFLADFVFHFDFAPASGTATGFIYYQEKSGIWQQEWVCWKDTQYDDCEVFDPEGKAFQPGKYTMQYSCSTFVWAWEHPSECRILNATRLGEIG